jgi:transposase
MSPEDRLSERDKRSRPIVEEFFTWLRAEQLKLVLLPSNPILKAAAYALRAEAGLRVFLGDQAVPVDTNQIERALRPIPMGRKNWLFCWIEVGAHAVAIIQSLVAACRVHAVRPFDYFVDVFQRVSSIPMSDVASLTPRNWAQSRTNTSAAN